MYIPRLVAGSRDLKALLQAFSLATVLVFSVAIAGQTKGPPRQKAAIASKISSCEAERMDVHLRGRKLPAYMISGAVLFTAGMQIDADGAPNAYGPRNSGLDYTTNAKNGRRWAGVVTDASGNPIVQRSGRYRGLYVSQTSLYSDGARHTAPQAYVNASKVPYVALPLEFTQQFGVALGDLVVAVNTTNGKRAYAIFADVGPNGKIGEGSIALARALGINADPRHGGVSGGISYLVFPKSGRGQGKLRTRDDINASGARLFKKWGGDRRLHACSSR